MLFGYLTGSVPHGDDGASLVLEILSPLLRSCLCLFFGLWQRTMGCANLEHLIDLLCRLEDYLLHPKLTWGEYMLSCALDLEISG